MRRAYWAVVAVAILGMIHAARADDAAPAADGPTVTKKAHAERHEIPVHNCWYELTVEATDPAGEAALVYTWEVVKQENRDAHITFSENGTNKAKATEARTDHSGRVTFRVTIKNAKGQTATSEVEENLLLPS